MNATNDVSSGGNGSNSCRRWVDTRKATRRGAESRETLIVLSAYYVLSVWRHPGMQMAINTTELCGKRWKEGEQMKQHGYKSNSYFSHSKTSHMFIAWRRIIVYEHRDGLLNAEQSYMAVFRSCVSAAACISFFFGRVRMRKATIAKLLLVYPSVRPPAWNNRVVARLGILHRGFVLTSVEEI